MTTQVFKTNKERLEAALDRVISTFNKHVENLDDDFIGCLDMGVEIYGVKISLRTETERP